MYKSLAMVFAVATIGLAKPSGLGQLAYNGQLVGPSGALVSASTSHVIQQNYNGLNQQLVPAPVPATYTTATLQGTPIVLAPQPAQISIAPQTLTAAPLTYSTAALTAATPLTLQAPTLPAPQYAYTAPSLTAPSAPSLALTATGVPTVALTAANAPAQQLTYATSSLASAPISYTDPSHAGQLAYSTPLSFAPTIARYAATGLPSTITGPGLW